MKLFNYIFIVFFLVINYTFAATSNITKKEIYTVGIPKDWKPYYFTDKQGTPRGFAIDVFKLLAEDSEIQYEYKIAKNWKELFKLLKAGKVDIIPNVGITSKRADFTLYSKPIDTFEIKLFKRANSSNINTVHNLKGKTVAVVAGNIGERLMRKHAEVNLKVFPNHFNAIRALLSGEVDAFCYPAPLTISTLNEMGLINKIIPFDTTIHEIKRAMGITVKYPFLLEKFNFSLEKLKRSKEYEKIYNRWFTYKKVELVFSSKEREYLRKKKELSVCVQPDWLPYEGIDKGKYIGISADYLNLISTKLKLPLKIVSRDTTKEVYELLQEGRCDIKPVVFASITQGKLPYKATEVYIKDKSSVVTRIKEPYFNNLEQHLDKKFVVLEFRERLIKSLQKTHPQIKIIKVKSMEKALKMVESEEVFGFIGKSLSSIYHIQENYASTLKVMNQFVRSDLGIGVKDDDTILFGLIEKALHSITEKEKIQIRNNWLMTTKELKQDYTLVWQIGIVVFIVVLLIMYFMNVKQKIDLEKQNKFTSNILNSQANLILISSGEKLYKTNQATLSFLGYKTLADFHKDYDCICDLFIKQEGYLQKEEKGILWYEVVLNNPSADYFAKLNDTEGNPHIFQVNTTAELVMDQYYVITLTDITELSTLKSGLEQKVEEEVEKNRQKDMELLEQSKLVSMGEMIGNIAHQWRQPLSVISTSASGAKVQKQLNDLSDEQFTKYMDNIVEQSQYLSKTIDDFRNFGKQEREELEFNVEETIQSFLHLIEGSIKNNNIVVDVDIQDDIKMVGYPNELIQCFINIFNNSKDALKELSIKRDFFIKVFKQEDECCIVFQDNGGGIPKDILSHVFEPYFTTKHKSQGTGLGLSMTHSLIVKGMGGSIEIKNISYQHDNEKLQGARTTIKLPIK